MATTEIKIDNHVYVLHGDESDEHLREVADLVKRRVETLRRKQPGLSLQKATMLAAFDFASQVVKGARRSTDYRSAILTKAKLLLDRVESELALRVTTTS